MRPKLILFAAVVAFVAVGWFGEHRAAVRLQAELGRQRARERELRALQSERARLREGLDALTGPPAVPPTAAEGSPAGSAPTALAVSPPPFSPGEWTPVSAWENRGQGTVRAAVATALWAAAGGDVRAFGSLLEFDDIARTRAAELLARLPSGLRNSYPTPDDLVASVTMKNIPLTQAQVSWLHQSDPDHAAVGLRLGKAAPAVTSPAAASAADPAAPPGLPETGQAMMVFLTLHRTGATWRVVVPAAAVDKIAREMTPPVD